MKQILLLIALPALLAGCASVDARVRAYTSRVDTEQLLGHVESLTNQGPRYVGDTAATERTLTYLERQLKEYGYTTWHEEFTLPEFVVVNLFAEHPGVSDPNEVIELSAHYDSVPGSAGADDNSSGVAGVLEIARLLAGAKLERSVRFCFFGAEEVGLIGSSLHVDSLDRYPSEVVGLLNLEMIGYATSQPDTQASPVRIPFLVWPPKQGDFICVVGNFSSGWIGNRFESAARRYVPQLRYFSANRIGGFFGDAARSDHFPYWQAGIPAVMLTDTANFRNPHYHRSSDTTETLDLTFMTRVVEASLATILEWAHLAEDASTPSPAPSSP